jgi:tetratricopeptide (TPR) repeat protein
LKQYKQVVESVMHLLNVSKKENYIHIEGSLYELLGNACFALKQYQAAINAYEKSISLDTFSQSNRSTLYAYMTIASLNLKNGNSNARA